MWVELVIITIVALVLCSVVSVLVNILNKRLLAGKAQQQVPKP
jgi:hypothetical protein